MTVKVSLRDDFKFIPEGDTLTVHCQLSIVHYNKGAKYGKEKTGIGNQEKSEY